MSIRNSLQRLSLYFFNVEMRLKHPRLVSVVAGRLAGSCPVLRVTKNASDGSLARWMYNISDLESWRFSHITRLVTYKISTLLTFVLSLGCGKDQN